MPPNTQGNIRSSLRNFGVTGMQNSSFVNRELTLTSQGWLGNLVSVANDFGLNRMVSEYGPDGKSTAKTIDSFFGRVIRGGQGYAVPTFQAVKENGKVINKVVWSTVDSLDNAAQAWSNHIKEAAQKTEGFDRYVAKARLKIHGLTGAPTSGVNKALAAAGGASKLFGPGLMLFGAVGDFKEGYREGGVVGGAVGAGMGIVKTKAMMEFGRAMLMNPLAGSIGALTIGGTIYSAHKMFSVSNQNANYIRMGRMQGLSFNSGNTPGMSGAMSSTIRGRALSAMENSRFNAMRSLGNESYMISAPRSRYANSTMISSQTPMLSY